MLLKLISLVSFHFLKLEDFMLHTWFTSYFFWTVWIYSVTKCNFLPLTKIRPMDCTHC